jgi:hypothetical protein
MHMIKIFNYIKNNVPIMNILLIIIMIVMFFESIIAIQYAEYLPFIFVVSLIVIYLYLFFVYNKKNKG